jgi:hypothetical protein
MDRNIRGQGQRRIREPAVELRMIDGERALNERVVEQPAGKRANSLEEGRWVVVAQKYETTPACVGVIDEETALPLDIAIGKSTLQVHNNLQRCHGEHIHGVGHFSERKPTGRPCGNFLGEKAGQALPLSVR